MTGLIGKNEYKFIDLRIINKTSSEQSTTLTPILGYEHGGDLIVPSDKKLVSEEYTPPQPTAVEIISNLYTNGAKKVVTNNGIQYNYANIYDIDSDDTTSGGLMNDRLGGTTASLDGGNIRYYGANPNNYIYFNCDDYSNQSADTCELWRIIGVFDGKVKIIRNESIGTFSWDFTPKGVKFTGLSYSKNQVTNDGQLSTQEIYNQISYYSSKTGVQFLAVPGDIADGSYANDWSKSTLKTLLNETYYNAGTTNYYNTSLNATVVDFTSIGIKNDITRSRIDEVTWNLGGWSDSNVYSNQIYNYERGETVYEGRPTIWTGKIGLMHASDYGYATDFTKCTQVLDNYGDNTCNSNDWLYNSDHQWLLNPKSDMSHFAIFVESSSRVRNENVTAVSGVRPVFFLSYEEVIESGDGSYSNPYKLSV